MKKMMTGLFLSAITLGGLTFSQTIVHANTWKANTPEQIQITKDQKEYTLKNGDTLWAIGQKININVEALAKINQIDLSKGEEKNLPIGRVISFDGNKMTVKEKDGSVVNQAVIKKEDKVDPKKPVGEPVADKKTDDTNSTSVAPATTNPTGSTEGNPSADVSAPGTSVSTETTNDTGNSGVIPSTPSQPQADVVSDQEPMLGTIGNSGKVFNSAEEAEAYGKLETANPSSPWFDYDYRWFDLANKDLEPINKWSVNFE